MNTVLLTGAAGGVGTMLRPLLRAVYPAVRLTDIKPINDVAPGETFVSADLNDMGALATACRGVDGILHFGGYATEASWDVIQQANITGCYALFEAARLAGVKRLVFASSNHAVGFYPRTAKIGPNVTARPDGLYGVSKVFGEALGALYADKHGMGVTALRIGNVGERPIDRRRLAIWLHPDDLLSLCRIGLEHPDVHFEVFYGASHNERAWWDNSHALRFGYRPKHRAEDHAAFALAEQAKLPSDPVGDHFQGGSFCSDGFSRVKPSEA